MNTVPVAFGEEVAGGEDGEPRPRYRGLAGLLTAEAISLSGTRLSMIAIPWFVISSTGSPMLTGLVA